jgi:excisionase family DNA binding protein
MVGHKRTVITIEQHRLTVVRSRRRSVVAWCERCGGEVRMVTPDEAAALTGISLRRIYRRVESGKLHFVETDAGALVICVSSL